MISSATKSQLFPESQLSNTSIILTTYTGEQMAVMGQMKVQVVYGKISKLLSLYVVEGQGPSLMGREWLGEIQLDWQKLNLASSGSVTQSTRTGCYLSTAKFSQKAWE